MPTEISETNRFDVKISADLLSKIVEPPVEIAVDGIANFRWGQDALRIKTVDAANAIVVDQEIPSSAFESYEVDPENNEIVFGTRCQTISNLLNAARTEEAVTLRLNKETNRMNIYFSDVNYQLTGVASQGVNEPEVPNLEFDIQATIHSTVLQRSYQVIGMMSDSIKFEVSPDRFQITGRGDADIAEIDVHLEPNKEAILDREQKCAATIKSISKRAEAKYGSQFINYVNQFTPSDCMDLYLREDYPLRIEAERGRGRIPTEITIAPRMDSS